MKFKKMAAVALAGALNAIRCDIYTDVEGVYTTDPRIVPHAVLQQTTTSKQNSYRHW